MLHHSTIMSQSPFEHHRVSLSSNLSHSLSFPSGFRSSSNFLPTVRRKARIISNKENPIVRCSVSQVGKSTIGWSGLYKRISFMQDTEMGAERVLNQHEKEGKRVYEWMNNRAQKYSTSTRDAAIQLGLIAKVRGVLDAEEYFLKLPDTFKDERTHGALLNAYVQAKSREKAESLIEKMKAEGHVMHSQPFNSMMSLYVNLEEYDKVDLVASEMRQKNICLDIYSYNIWLSSCGAQGSIEKMEQVFETMMENSIRPDWSTFSTMAAIYIKLGHFEKAETCIKKGESRIKGWDKVAYHYVISLYSSVGKREEVYRVWKVYKLLFPRIPNLGYYTMISSLVRLGDIEGAEQLYEEWQLVKSNNEPRIVNVLMSCYVRNGLLEKAEALFDQMIALGGKPNSKTWETLAERYIRENRVFDALSCLKEALLADGSKKKWKPRAHTVFSILKICEQNEDTESKDVLMGLLRQVGCFEDEAYMTYLSSASDEERRMEKRSTHDEVDEDKNGHVSEKLINELLSNGHIDFSLA
ncbi:hypothetical protein RHGRI_019348 [Rhododendron griersonianum]|uniref:Pentatricopeptide repeat-containing protein n=1 Tax=Rhododendron griersonianum TaxID=479676 RepID=A0AAV6JF47_9ERIC|nr:hypothetical protein RHGRI_019348 [Rhododendron griersonianum]